VVGVAIGAAGMAPMGFVLHDLWGEYRKFERAGRPTEVTIEAMAVGEGETR